MTDPPRLSQDPESPTGLAEDLARATETPARRYDTARGLAALKAGIGATAGAGAGGATAGAGVSTGALMALGSSVVIGGLLLGGWWVASGRNEATGTGPTSAEAAIAGAASAEVASAGREAALPELGSSGEAGASGPRASSSGTPVGPAPVEALPTPTVIGATNSEAEQDAEGPEAAAPAASSRQPPAPRAVTDPDELLRLETAQLVHIRRLLSSDPSAALELARVGQRRFRGGMFDEERGALSILALHRLGRERAFRRDATRFLRDHPAGPFSAEIRQLLEGS